MFLCVFILNSFFMIYFCIFSIIFLEILIIIVMGEGKIGFYTERWKSLSFCAESGMCFLSESCLIWVSDYFNA